MRGRPWREILVFVLGIPFLAFAPTQERGDPFEWPATGRPASVQPHSFSTGPARLQDLTVDTVRVRGTVSGAGFRFALLEGPGTRTFLAAVGARLADAGLHEIGDRYVVFAINRDGSHPGHRGLTLISKSLEGPSGDRELDDSSGSSNLAPGQRRKEQK